MKYFSKINLLVVQKISLLIFGLLLLAGIYLEFVQSSQNSTGVSENSLVFVLDVSKSMNVLDVNQNSRLNAAKREIYEIMIENEGYEFALNIFAGESQRIIPFTTDVSLVATFLDGINNQNVSIQGSDISAALEDVLDSFGESRQGSFILFTDGDEDEVELSPELVTIFTDANISSSIVGVGSKDGGYIPETSGLEPFVTYNGETVISGLNADSLQLLAQQLNGNYYALGEKIQIDSIGGKLNKNMNVSLIFLISFLVWGLYIGIWMYRIYFKNRK
ncbi:VWA domain-containing protein [Candidatus Gracilibacteria bacterium]|nr:VWA domain-containing protein [Candidatus Gracilibacteria bacterium]